MVDLFQNFLNPHLFGYMWFYVNLNDDVVAHYLEVGYVEHHPRGWIDPPCHRHLEVRQLLSRTHYMRG